MDLRLAWLDVQALVRALRTWAELAADRGRLERKVAFWRRLTARTSALVHALKQWCREARRCRSTIRLVAAASMFAATRPLHSCRYAALASRQARSRRLVLAWVRLRHHAAHRRRACDLRARSAPLAAIATYVRGATAVLTWRVRARQLASSSRARIAIAQAQARASPRSRARCLARALSAWRVHARREAALAWREIVVAKRWRLRRWRDAAACARRRDRRAVRHARTRHGWMRWRAGVAADERREDARRLVHLGPAERFALDSLACVCHRRHVSRSLARARAETAVRKARRHHARAALAAAIAAWARWRGARAALGRCVIPLRRIAAPPRVLALAAPADDYYARRGPGASNYIDASTLGMDHRRPRAVRPPHWNSPGPYRPFQLL